MAQEKTGEAVLGEITVTGTREAVPKSETPATVGTVDAEVIEQVRPAHPSEIIGRIPGVHVSVTGGEGHMTAIRQPISTSPLYLYLEDGIPTRSTGFFNHNALYEVNIPQAAGIEVNKGPGTALYGSDAIGGIINVLTRPAPLEAEAEVNVEAGGHGWKRLLATAGNTWDEDGLRADLNITHTDGWRDATDYDRQSGTLRW
ncbi:MAG TPA: TonB-dependent receptor, partial [Gammaproteobacteria bacterium]|nr:TonB-dependent receptor [Gammaproteobacteria bacterium]